MNFEHINICPHTNKESIGRTVWKIYFYYSLMLQNKQNWKHPKSKQFSFDAETYRTASLQFCHAVFAVLSCSWGMFSQSHSGLLIMTQRNFNSLNQVDKDLHKYLVKNQSAIYHIINFSFHGLGPAKINFQEWVKNNFYMTY